MPLEELRVAHQTDIRRANGASIASSQSRWLGDTALSAATSSLALESRSKLAWLYITAEAVSQSETDVSEGANGTYSALTSYQWTGEQHR